MKILYTLLLSFMTMLAFAEKKQDTLLNERIKRIEMRINDLVKNIEEENLRNKDKLDFQQKMIEQSGSNISNQLASASYNLTLFGILFTIAAVLLGVYVSLIERKVVKISKENQALLERNQKIKDDVERINNLIHNDIQRLFIELKREETIHILDRLIKVPEDIANLCELLLARELEQEDFRKLRQAYLNLPQKNREYTNSYHLLFFQHFLSQTLRDPDLKVGTSDYIPTGIINSFENDIIKSTIDFATLLVDTSINEFEKEIRQFFKGLTSSEYKNFAKVYQALFNNLKTRKNRFDLFNTVESIPEQRIAKIEFGKLLQAEYLNDNPTESERISFDVLNQLLEIK